MKMDNNFSIIVVGDDPELMVLGGQILRYFWRLSEEEGLMQDAIDLGFKSKMSLHNDILLIDINPKTDNILSTDLRKTDFHKTSKKIRKTIKKYLELLDSKGGSKP